MPRARSVLVAALSGTLLPAAPVLGQAQAPATATGTAIAEVVTPIALVREADLDFGTVAVSPASGGTVKIVPLAAGASYTGGVDGLCGTACAMPHAARFAVQGEPGRAFLITLPAQLSIPVPGAAPGAVVVVDSLIAASISAPQTGRGILSNQGRDRFEVGGTLHLPAAAPAAQYTKQVPVIVQYM